MTPINKFKNNQRMRDFGDVLDEYNRRHNKQLYATYPRRYVARSRRLKLYLYIIITVVIGAVAILVWLGVPNTVRAEQEFAGVPISTPQVTMLNSNVSLEVVKIEKPKPVAASSECSYWDSVIDSYTDVEGERAWLKRVMRCESRCNPNAINKSSGASGLFQYIGKWHPAMVGKVFDGDESIKYALMKYRAGGAQLWECK